MCEETATSTTTEPRSCCTSAGIRWIKCKLPAVVGLIDGKLVVSVRLAREEGYQGGKKGADWVKLFVDRRLKSRANNKAWQWQGQVCGYCCCWKEMARIRQVHDRAIGHRCELVPWSASQIGKEIETHTGGKHCFKAHNSKCDQIWRYEKHLLNCLHSVLIVTLLFFLFKSIFAYKHWLQLSRRVVVKKILRDEENDRESGAVLRHQSAKRTALMCN